MDECNQYLANEVLTQEHLITYRTLSRALKIHVNTAKAYLYEFHCTQKATDPNSVHATYLILGTLDHEYATHQNRGDQDVSMSGTAAAEYPFSDPVPVETISLAGEGKLEATLRRYKKVHSIQLYSIGPGVLGDLRLLSDLGQQCFGKSTAGDLEHVGTITNPAMTRRNAGNISSMQQPTSPQNRPSAGSSSHPLKTVPAKSDFFFKSGSQKPKAPREPKNSNEPVKKATAAPRGIMSAFAKARPKATPTPLSDDGEDDSQPMPHPNTEKEDADPAAKEEGQQEEEPSTTRKSRLLREAELRRMMEEDDDDEVKPESPDEESMEELPEEAAPEPESVKEEPAETAVVSDGRRRGKRRVTRKKQVMDDEGFLVTMKDIVWESFSEAEEEPVVSKPKTSASTTQSIKANPPAKRGPKAGGQGSITSFFAKKT